MDTISLIEKLSNSPGAPGFEDEVCQVVKENCGELKYYKDSMQNVYLLAQEYDKSKPTLMLDAHLDEVGFMVQAIDGKGLISFLALGGWNASTLPSHKVRIQNRDGEYISGVIISKPSHLSSSSDNNKKVEIEDLKIDVGATSREEVINEFKIDLAAPIVPFVQFEYNQRNGIMCGKAFDNRLGCGVVIKVLQSLVGKNLDVNVVGALATQEEVGTRGAQVTAYNISPDIAIVFEGTPADDSYTDAYSCQSGLKKGPQLRHRDSSFIANHRFIKFAKKVGDENIILYQEAVRRAGGTNSGKIHLTGKGVPTIVIGVPSRYIHSHFCYAALDDFNGAVSWATKIIENLTLDNINSIKNIYK